MTISVIIPLYYGISYVSTLLKMLEQNNKHLDDDVDMEVIFVKDSQEEYDKSVFVSEDIKIRVLENETNGGIHYSRVRGLSVATGAYVHMLDQDDKISNTFYKYALRGIGKSDVLVCNGIKECVDFLKNMSYNKNLYRCSFMQWTVKHLWFYTKFSCRILSPGQCLIRKESIPEAWMEHILTHSGADDAFLWMLMLKQKKQFAIDREIRYIHKNTNRNLSLDDEKMKASLKEVIGICGKYKFLSKRDVQRMRKGLYGAKKGLCIWIIEIMNRFRSH